MDILIHPSLLNVQCLNTRIKIRTSYFFTKYEYEVKFNSYLVLIENWKKYPYFFILLYSGGWCRDVGFNPNQTEKLKLISSRYIQFQIY